MSIFRDSVTRLALLGICWFLCGCANEANVADGIVVRDSAGIEIIEHRGDVWSAPQTLELSVEPVLRIGAVAGDDAYLFDNIIAIAALRDGRIVVGDRGDHTLRWYSRRGEFLMRRGGEGEGPGEFSSLYGPTLSDGDTIVAFDYGANRVARFTGDGEFVSTTRVTAPRLTPGVVYRLADGSLVANLVPRVLADIGFDVQPGMMRLPHRLLRIAPRGARVDTIGTFPGRDTEITPSGGGTGVFLAREVSFLASGNKIYIGTQDRFVIDAYSPAGSLRRSIRGPDVDNELDADTLEAFKSWMLGRFADLPAEDRAQQTREFEEMLEAMTLPETIPAYSEFLLDHSENLWVAEYRYERNTHPPNRWVVFNPDGRLVSAVQTPDGFELLAVASDVVFGQFTDDMNVPFVVGYEIQR